MVQHRFQLQQDHRPRHGPLQQPKPDITMAPVALRHQYGPRWQPRPQESHDPHSNRSHEYKTDPGWTQTWSPAAALAWTSSWHHTAVHATQNYMVPGPLVTTGATDIDSDPDCCRVRDPDMAVGSETQTRPLASSQAWRIPWPWVAAQTTQIRVARWQHGFWTPTQSPVVAQTLDILVTFGGNMGHEGHTDPGCGPWQLP